MTQTIAVIGGSGNLGAALARRWAKAGRSVIIGSRDAAKAANAAAQLREFSAGWILDRYGPDPPPGDGWHWYSNDWRGQRGDMPTPEQVVETIAKRKTAARPAPQANGRSRSRAEEAAVEYAQMRQEFFSNGQDTDDS